MTPLVEKYRPRTLDAFAGMAGPRALLGAFAADPYEAAFLLLGPSGLGKTTMALALAEAINGEVHHVPSRSCDLATVEDLVHRCWYVPMASAWHVCIVDECDQMTRAAQLAFLSKLDTTAAPPRTIFLFTANDTTLLEPRFLSRCRIVKFSCDEALLEPAAELLRTIWAAEALGRAEPDFRAMVRDNQFNVRSAIMTLEMELLASGTFVPAVFDVAFDADGEKLAIVVKARVARSLKRVSATVSPVRSGDVVDAYQAGMLLGIHQATVYERLKQGRLPKPQRDGRRWVWNRSEIEAVAC